MNGDLVELPALSQLMGAYLHQDYDIFGPTPADAAEVFLRDEPARRRALPAEVEAVLQSHSEAELGELLASLGCQVLPWAEDGTYSTSLRELAGLADQMA